MPPNTATHTVSNGVFEPKNDVKKKWELFGEYTIFGIKFDHKLKYKNIVFITLFHLGFVYYSLTYPWIEKWKLTLFLIVYINIAGFGVTAGVHRYFTHRCYKTTTPIKILLLVCYAAAGHNKLYDWVRDHRVHHKYSETDADPHNAKRGFFFAHVGWLMMNKHPDVIAKGRDTDMSDISSDRLVVWFDRYFTFLKLFFCFIFPISISRFCFDDSWFHCITAHVFIRYVLLLNSTWIINSAAHLIGTKPYDKRINPSDNIAVNFLSIGEGRHNYHHTFPWDYKASELGTFNMTTFFLDMFAKLGWVYDLRAPSQEMVTKYASKYGDGSHKPFRHYVSENGEIKNVED